MKKQVITIGKRDFEIGKRPYVMGILNVTPDSFSDGGKYGNLDEALKHTLSKLSYTLSVARFPE